MKKDSQAVEISTIQVPPNYPFHSFHYVEECDCGAVIFKCDCNSVSVKPSDVTKVVKAGCKDCESKASETARISAEVQENDKISKENKKSVNDVTDLIAAQKMAVANLEKQKEIIKKKNKMKYKFSDLNKEILETLAAADVYEVAVELDKSMTKFAEDRDAKTAELKASKDEYEKLKSDSAATAKQLEEVKAELTKMEEARAKEKIQSDFNLRMADLNEKYELGTEQSKSIAGDIRGLDDESFTKWEEKMKAFLVAKKLTPVTADPEKAKKAADKDAKKMAGEKSGDKADDAEPDDDGDEDSGNFPKKKKSKSSEASLLDEIKKLKSETPAIVQKIEGNKSIQELVAAAFGGIFEDKKVS